MVFFGKCVDFQIHFRHKYLSIHFIRAKFRLNLILKRFREFDVDISTIVNTAWKKYDSPNRICSEKCAMTVLMITKIYWKELNEFQ